jgi:hypothetical protein
MPNTIMALGSPASPEALCPCVGIQQPTPIQEFVELGAPWFVITALVLLAASFLGLAAAKRGDLAAWAMRGGPKIGIVALVLSGLWVTHPGEWAYWPVYIAVAGVVLVGLALYGALTWVEQLVAKVK